MLLVIVFKIGQIQGLKEGYRRGKFVGYSKTMLDYLHADMDALRNLISRRTELKKSIGLVGEKEDHGNQTGDTPKTK